MPNKVKKARIVVEKRAKATAKAKGSGKGPAGPAEQGEELQGLPATDGGPAGEEIMPLVAAEQEGGLSESAAEAEGDEMREEVEVIIEVPDPVQGRAPSI